MKKRSKKQIAKRKKEFRFHKVSAINRKGINYESWHPAYVFIEKGNIYIYVTITHSANVKDKIVIKLRRNPNKNDNRDSYYVAEVREDTKDKFGKRHANLKIDEQDDFDIKKLYKKR